MFTVCCPAAKRVSLVHLELSRPIWICVAALLGLAVLNAGIWLADIKTDPILPGAAPTEVRTAAVPASGNVMQPLSAYSETLSRPLFQPQRRPMKIPAVAVSPDVTRQPAAPDGLRVLGMIDDGQGASRVLISSPRSSQGMWVAVGEDIEGWTIASIGAGAITLSAGPARRELSLFAPSATPASIRK